ncbi:MAG: hypothetical protein LBJ31_11210 [Treponema sp.]|jgi:hypothetical protein|nr:hypothetical protein [Treponema sp.]
MNPEKTEHYKTVCRAVIKNIASNSSRIGPVYEKINEIFIHYERYREIIHRNMPYRDSVIKTDPLMDNHKIAGAFFCSFLKAKPLSYIPDGSGIPPTYMELKGNEHGAFLFGLQVVQDFWIDKFHNSVSPIDKEIYRNAINFPQTTDDDHYIHWFVKLVTDGVDRYFDYQAEKFQERFIFFVSHIYFMLENYSYQYHKAKLHENRSEYLNRELTIRNQNPKVKH